MGNINHNQTATKHKPSAYLVFFYGLHQFFFFAKQHMVVHISLLAYYNLSEALI